MTTAVSAAAPDPSSLRLWTAASSSMGTAGLTDCCGQPRCGSRRGVAHPAEVDRGCGPDSSRGGGRGRRRVLARGGGPGRAGLFAKRLAWAGLDPERLGEWLPWRAPERTERRRAAARVVAGARGAARGGSQRDRDDAPARGRPADASDIPFADLLAPIVSWNAERLARELGTEHRRRVADAAWDGLQSALLQRLAEICAPTLGQEFSLTRTAGANLTLGLLADAGARAPHRGRYRAWCRDQLADGLTGILGKYPVLGRLIVMVGQQWRRNTAQLLSRVARDRQLLSARLGCPRQHRSSASRPD